MTEDKAPCCSTVVSKYSPEELKRGLEEARRQIRLAQATKVPGVPVVASEVTVKAKPLIPDIEVVYPMLRFLDKRPLSAVGADADAVSARLDVVSYVYECLNWDRGTGLCTIYETRPAMCRQYEKCNFLRRCTSTVCEIRRRHLEHQRVMRSPRTTLKLLLALGRNLFRFFEE